MLTPPPPTSKFRYPDLTTWTPRAGCGLVLALAAGCAPALTPEIPASNVTDVVSVQRPDKPELISITRDGDPEGALSFVALHGGDSRVSRVLVAHFIKALAAEHLTADSILFTDAIAIRVPLAIGAPSAVFRALQHALSSPVVSSPLTGQVVVDACGTRGEAISPQTALARLGVSSSAFGVVGTAELVTAVNHAYAEMPAFPTGEPTPVTWGTSDTTDVVAGTNGRNTLVVAVRTDARPRAPSAARLLAGEHSMLPVLAASFSPGWTLRGTSATFRPGAACVVTEFTSTAPHAAHTAGIAARALADEIDYTVRSLAQVEETRLEALEASDPRDAATQAAWEALTAHPGPPLRSVFSRYAGDVTDPDAFNAGFVAEPRRELPLVERLERGQGRIWAYLGRPCAALYEDATTAGHTAATLFAAAARAQPNQELQIVPVLSDVGMGLVASIPTRDAYAEDRLADGLVRALLTPGLDIDGTRERLSRAYANADAWQLALKLASPGHPSLLEPLAAGVGLNGFGVTSAKRMLNALLNGPLELRVLGNRTGQGARLSARLIHLLRAFPGNGESCQNLPMRPLVGEYSASAPTGDEAVLLFNIPGAQLNVARAVALWLNRSGGWFERSLVVPGLAAGVTASAIGWQQGAAAFAITLHGWSGSPSNAVMQTRALLKRLAQTPLGPDDQAAFHAAQEAARTQETPIARLLQTATPEPLDPGSLPHFLKNQLTDANLTLVVPPPAGTPNN